MGTLILFDLWFEFDQARIGAIWLGRALQSEPWICLRIAMIIFDLSFEFDQARLGAIWRCRALQSEPCIWPRLGAIANVYVNP